jgi:hypothetical protein
MDVESDQLVDLAIKVRITVLQNCRKADVEMPSKGFRDECYVDHMVMNPVVSYEAVKLQAERLWVSQAYLCCIVCWLESFCIT